MTAAELTVLLALLTAYAVLAGADTGLRGLNLLRLHHRVREGLADAQRVAWLLNPPHRTPAAVRVASLALRSGVIVWLWHCAPGLWHAVAWTTGLAVLGDALPRTWFLMRPIDRLSRITGLLRVVERSIRPLVRGSPGAAGGGTGLADHSPRVTREAIDHLVQDGVLTGAITPMERVMIRRVFELQRRPVRELMVPFERMRTIPAEATIAELYERLRETGFTRLPVTDPRAESGFAGVINLFHVVGQAVDETRPVREFIRPPLYVPADLAVADLLPRLRRNRQPMALVRDAQGQVLGLTTIDDILSVVVQVEADLTPSPAGPPPPPPAAAGA